MNTKMILAIMICGIFVATIFIAYGNYQYGLGNNKGYALGYSRGQQSDAGASLRSYQSGNETGYLQGYQAALNAVNGTG